MEYGKFAKCPKVIIKQRRPEFREAEWDKHTRYLFRVLEDYILLA